MSITPRSSPPVGVCGPVDEFLVPDGRSETQQSGRVTVLRTRDMDDLAEDLIEVADRISVGLGMISAVPR